MANGLYANIHAKRVMERQKQDGKGKQQEKAYGKQPKAKKGY